MVRVAGDTSVQNARILDAMLRLFADRYSPSVQATMWDMAQAAFDACGLIDEITLALPNKHYLPANLTPFGIDATGVSFVPTDEPHGQIEATMRFAGARSPLVTTQTRTPEDFMREAIRLAEDGMYNGHGGPFGCVVVRAGGRNRRPRQQPGNLDQRPDGARRSGGDPRGLPPSRHLPAPGLRTLHQLRALPDVPGGDLLGADPARALRQHPRRRRGDQFDDDFLYEEIAKNIADRRLHMTTLLRDEAMASFREWLGKEDKVRY